MSSGSKNPITRLAKLHASYIHVEKPATTACPYFCFVTQYLECTVRYGMYYNATAGRKQSFLEIVYFSQREVYYYITK